MFVIISNFSKEFLFWNGHPEYLLSFNQSKHSTKLIIQLVDEKKVSGPKYLLSLELVLRSYFDFEREMVKIKSGFFLLESTPWGHVLSLKGFCWNPVLGWAIMYLLTFFRISNLLIVSKYLIAQLRTGFHQKYFTLKTCPQGVLQAQ